MKEKVLSIVKCPLVIGTVGLLILTIVFGVITSKKKVEYPEVVEEFCRVLEDYEYETLKEFLLNNTKEGQFTIENVIMKQVDDILGEDGNTANCTLGNVRVEKLDDKEVTVYPAMMTVYKDGEIIAVYDMSFTVQRIDGKEMVIDWYHSFALTR